MKQLPKNNESFALFEADKLELSEMLYLKGGGGDGSGSGGEDTGENPPPPPPPNP